MYLIGSLPKHTIVFEYGKRLTQKRKNKASEILLDFVEQNYDLPSEHMTMKRSKQTLDNELRFGRYKQFEKINDRKYKTENGTNTSGKQIVTYNIE